MKSKIIALIILITCFVKVGHSQYKQAFELFGQFKGLPDGTKVYLRTQEKDTIAKAISNEDRFILSGVLPRNGRFHFIAFDTLISKVNSNAIFLVNSKMTVTGLLGKRAVKVEGSKGHDEYNEIVDKMASLDNERKKLIENWSKIYRAKSDFSAIEFKQKDTESRKKIDSIIIKQNKIGLKWITEHPGSLSVPYMILNYKGIFESFTDFEEVFNNLTPEAKASYYGFEVKKELERTILAGKVKPGNILPDFNVSTVDQNSFSVLEYAKKSQITLIDFWASWCKPCRAETPNMKKVYAAFRNRGFNIIGVSTDAKEADWRKALQEDGAPWFHGLDNLEKATKGIFGISAIPAFALVDKEGKLIAFSCGMSNIPSFGPPIRGEELYKTIETLINEKNK